jgi:hypothetical protein
MQLPETGTYAYYFRTTAGFGLAQPSNACITLRDVPGLRFVGTEPLMTGCAPYAPIRCRSYDHRPSLQNVVAASAIPHAGQLRPDDMSSDDFPAQSFALPDDTGIRLRAF